MRLVVDIETNSLIRPSKIWVIVCKDIDTGEMHVYRPSEDNGDAEHFLKLAENVTLWVGHNWLEYDYPVLHSLIGLDIPSVADYSIDTLIISRLVDYPRPSGHSVESYGLEFGLEKVKFNDFKQYSKEMEDYCIRDVEITDKIFDKYKRYINNANNRNAISLEHRFQLVVNDLHNNGFTLNRRKAEKILGDVTEQLLVLDESILKEFPPKLKLVREITPKVTKHGTLSRTDFRFITDGDLSDYNGGPFCRCEWVEFNPSSHKQIIDVLNNAGWRPTDKTKTHIEVERELSRLDRSKNRDQSFDITRKRCYDDLIRMRKVGWKVSEQNLLTLPPTAPSPARKLAERILLESRRRTLTEWLGLLDDDGRIHGKFLGIGAWTHRMAHQKPNTANIPNDLDTFGKKKLLGKEMRSLWCAPRNRLLVGVDAEGIQLRLFAHYIDDPEFTKALVDGKKEDKSDPHSLNARILGPVCHSRSAAKRFIYALLLGAGLGKLGEILGCSEDEARSALARIMERYTGFTHLKETIIPADAKRGWFVGLDGRPVRIPGETVSERRHLAMSGYLQNGEAIVMKRACLKWQNLLKEEKAILVNFVHDEWQTETPNDMKTALAIAKTQADSLRIVGEELGLKCPLAGSYFNDDLKDYTIATNWAYTH